MGISYSGMAIQVTETLVTALDDLAHGRSPSGIPFGPGTVTIQPTLATGGFAGGNFSVVAEDVPAALLAYRFLVTSQLSHPCQPQQDAVREASDHVRSAIQEGVSQATIVRLRKILDARRSELAQCTTAAGIDLRGFDHQAGVFRSRDLLRTGSGKFESGLVIFVRVLTAQDLQQLQSQNISIPSVTSYSTIMTLAQATAPPGLSITNVGPHGGLLRIDFSQGSLTGSCTAALRPSLSHNFESYIEIELIDLDLNGLVGWLALCTNEDLIRLRIQDALDRAANRFNRGIASAVQLIRNALPAALPAPTLTLLDVSLRVDGIHATAVLGVLINSHPDPCQSLRDDLRELKLELTAAIGDGASQTIINKLKADIARKQNELNGCLAANS
jgi:hypothetical protein